MYEFPSNHTIDQKLLEPSFTYLNVFPPTEEAAADSDGSSLPDDGECSGEGSDWGEEDDPDRLWCICRKPYNKRFMISCDQCQQWYHGSCVGVTKRQGKEMEKENVEWKCSNCLKGKIGQKDKVKTSATADEDEEEEEEDIDIDIEEPGTEINNESEEKPSQVKKKVIRTFCIHMYIFMHFGCC